MKKVLMFTTIIFIAISSQLSAHVCTIDGKYNAPERRKEIINNLKEITEYVPAIADQQATMAKFVSPGIFDDKDSDAKKTGALDKKTKLLISIAVLSSVRCGDCASLFIAQAAKAGLTKKEILEAACTAIAFQGGPTMGFISTVILPAIKQNGIK